VHLDGSLYGVTLRKIVILKVLHTFFNLCGYTQQTEMLRRQVGLCVTDLQSAGFGELPAMGAVSILWMGASHAVSLPSGHGL
jgi:hypothetical protein